jgi:hypothetical protein
MRDLKLSQLCILGSDAVLLSGYFPTFQSHYDTYKRRQIPNDTASHPRMHRCENLKHRTVYGYETLSVALPSKSRPTTPDKSKLDGDYGQVLRRPRTAATRSCTYTYYEPAHRETDMHHYAVRT